MPARPRILLFVFRRRSNLTGPLLSRTVIHPRLPPPKNKKRRGRIAASAINRQPLRGLQTGARDKPYPTLSKFWVMASVAERGGLRGRATYAHPNLPHENRRTPTLFPQPTHPMNITVCPIEDHEDFRKMLPWQTNQVAGM